MSELPTDVQYSTEHEWVAGDVAPDAVVTIGITAFAAEALGDIVYVEAPTPGTEVSVGDVIGELESTKAVSELYAPVTGTVEESNAALADAPELLNNSPYGDGWIVKVRVTAPAKGLLSADEYAAIAK